MIMTEDNEICKAVLLQSLDHAIREKSLDVALLPAIQALNDIEGVVTVQSCEGHGTTSWCAYIELNVSDRNWRLMNQYAEKIILDSNLADMLFHYYAVEEGVERSVRLRTHPGVRAEASCPVFIQTAKILKELRVSDVK